MADSSVSVVTPPSEEPVSVLDAQSHLRVDSDVDEDYVAGLIVAARQWCEQYCNRSFVTQTLALRLDAVPAFGWIELRRPPVQSVTSVAYVDAAGVTQTLPPTDYVASLHGLPPRILPAFGGAWPTTRIQPDAMTVTYVAGYGAASAVPAPIRQAMLLLIGHYYENRESVVVGKAANELPMAVESLLAPYVVPFLR